MGNSKAAELHVANPYTGDLIDTLHFEDAVSIEKTLSRAASGFTTWRHSTSYERSSCLDTAAKTLETERERFSKSLSIETGKPITLAKLEIERAIHTLKWASAEALRFAGESIRIDTVATGRTGHGFVDYFPLGVVLGITPFNFPVNLAVHKIAPALASGNAIILKPSLHTVKISMMLLELFESSLPPGTLQVCLAPDELVPNLSQDPRVKLVSFTGSAAIGRIIQNQCPTKKVVLELGGNATCIVCEDTEERNLTAIVDRIANSAFNFAGQSCISVQNLAVHRTKFNEVKKLLKAAVEQFPYGNPADEIVQCGPVIDHIVAERMQHLIADSAAPDVKEVVRSKNLIHQSTTVAPPDTLIAPTLLIMDRFNTSPIFSEEAFGPILTLYPYDTLEEVIQQINQSRYGLQCGVYTCNLKTIEILFQHLDVGGLIVNDTPSLRLEHQPYGGVKDSGSGREGIKYAMQEMSVTKFLSLSSEIH